MTYSDMFRDKIYEELDDISKMIEPFICETNENLSKFPDKVEIDYDFLYANCVRSYGFNSINKSTILNAVAKIQGNKYVETNSYELADKFFEIKVEDLCDDEEITFDLDHENISHKVFLVKKKIGLEDDEIYKNSIRNFERKLLGTLRSNRLISKPRMNEVAKLFGAYKVLKDRSWRGKLSLLKSHMVDMMETNKLEIKNAELYTKLATWISLYVRDGNIPAYKNMTKIKIMTHQDKPIYSIEEEKVWKNRRYQNTY